MFKLYRTLTSAVAPLIPLWLNYRSSRGKEMYKRLHERYGISKIKRPAGTLLWLHAASVGEANSVLPLISMLRQDYPALHILLTTGTVTSAQLMRHRLPQGVVHQFVPIDTPEATRRFIRHWKPDIAIWVESEFWPNLVHEANDYQCFMAVVNGRLSSRSFAFWQKHPEMMRKMMGSFDYVFAQSEDDATRFKYFGAREVVCLGNMKFDGDTLACDETELYALDKAIGSRRVWLAASTHPGEEAMIANVHSKLRRRFPDILTIIVPRHPVRGDEIATMLAKKHQVTIRSRKQPLTPQTDIYIADTLGELGLFYRLSEIVFMGGSLVKHGGQNPLEPSRLSCAILAGPHVHNFSDIYSEMKKEKAYCPVANQQELAEEVADLLQNTPLLDSLQNHASEWVENKSGATEELLGLLKPVLSMSFR